MNIYEYLAQAEDSRMYLWAVAERELADFLKLPPSERASWLPAVDVPLALRDALVQIAHVGFTQTQIMGVLSEMQDDDAAWAIEMACLNIVWRHEGAMGSLP